MVGSRGQPTKAAGSLRTAWHCMPAAVRREGQALGALKLTGADFAGLDMLFQAKVVDHIPAWQVNELWPSAHRTLADTTVGAA